MELSNRAWGWGAPPYRPRPAATRATAPGPRDKVKVSTGWTGAIRQARADALREEVRAHVEGAALGAQHRGNPWRAAAAMGIEVRRVPIASLQDADDARFVLGRIWRVNPPVVEIGAELRSGDAETTLRHELGHAVGFRDEALADVFGKAFQEAAR